MEHLEKIKKAEIILSRLKTELLEILLKKEKQDYCSDHMMLPWIEEDAEYLIKKLQLSKEDEKSFIRKIHNIFGVYSEEMPLLKRKRRWPNRRK
ncbi:MAG: hypothetical protein K9G67_05310 [Bacteroidales bacterium]|nr:hypothetical protein [Bacteroidales bacterium]MCF8343283.1 hypothetical protein [Bacteroidales bacterium]MCF8350855.1 hypothetical protein [Bacteroidales bacterium]MCF8375752.1 hypothetical protein [Bacteroidales bacterium]MCF8400352.1 hypothetical protein [Bacteroidales bacterium]